jgi:putative transposase
VFPSSFLPATLVGIMRYTTFRFALAPTPAQASKLARHAGASRFAYNQCLELVREALDARRADPQVRVPWSRFDLINAFNGWKNSQDAGRLFVVAPDGTIDKHVTGLCWRREVSAQVFEEAAVDCARALAAFRDSRSGSRRGRRVRFPKRKLKRRCRDSFRIRNKQHRPDVYLIRVGEGHPRSVTLPTIGQIKVHDDTRRLRRLLRSTKASGASSSSLGAPRARILFATIARYGARWYVSLNVQACNFHPERRHQPRISEDDGAFVGVDRGLTTFAVAATAEGIEVGRFHSPKPLKRRLRRLRRRSRVLSRASRGSNNWVKAAHLLAREHARIANVRRNFLHEVSSQLAKTHSRLAIEDLTVINLAANRRLARAIADAAWAEFGRQLSYKAAWLGAELVVCDRWFPSSKTCSRCGRLKEHMTLAERVLRCDGCGLVIDRDRNAAANLAAWAERHHAQAPDRQAGGRESTPLEGKVLAIAPSDGETSPSERGTNTPSLAGVEDTRGGWRPSSSPMLFDAL